MARPRKIGADDSNLPIGPMDEKTFKRFLKELDLAQAEVEEAADEVKSARSHLSAKWKEFKKQGGKSDAMRESMAMRKMEEGDLVQHEEDRKRYALWMKLPIGEQPDLFAGACDGAENDDEQDEASDGAPPPAAAAPLTERSRRGPRGPKLVEPQNTTNSPLN